MFDPSERMTVEEALEHGYLETWHAFGEEEGCGVVSSWEGKRDWNGRRVGVGTADETLGRFRGQMFDTSFEAENTIEGMKVCTVISRCLSVNGDNGEGRGLSRRVAKIEG